ncbi:MAG: ABC transporter ATP-binding protein/permease [Clostridiaceae bacterium]|nr:ABC transporter ATP-binding protein/permease [Clostridiaceae bacterium]
MKEKINFIWKRIREGRLKEFFHQTVWIYSYVRKYWLSILFYTAMGMVGTGTSLISSLLSKDLVDIITGYRASELLKTFVMYISFTVANILISQLLTYISNMVSLKVDNEIKADVFEKMLITRLEPLMAYHTGDLLTRWNSDASVISSGVLNWIPDLVINIVRFFAALGIVIYYDPVFALLALMGMPVSMVMSKTLLYRMQSNNKESAAMNAKMMGFHQETFSNIQTLKAFDLIPLYVQRLRDYQKEYFDMRKRFQKLSIFTSVLMSVVGLVVSYSCYGMGIYRVWTGAISYGTMTLFLSLSGNLSSTLNTLISMVPTAISITTSAGRLIDILDMPREDYSDREAVAAFYQRNRNGGLKLQIEDMSYAYYNGTKVFEGASIQAEPHRIVALVGPSGEGKTTLLRILLALVEPQCGTLRLVGGEHPEDVISFSPSIRQLYSYVPQGNTMFSGTVAENLRNVKPEATDDEIIYCLKMACAWEFVEKLPDGVESRVGERGTGFSEGQAQRLSIARALLKRAPILLLDEATSALDVATERRILKNIMQDEYPRTCIVTTHRPTVLGICDTVYAIRDMKCVILSREEIAQMIQDF